MKSSSGESEPFEAGESRRKKLADRKKATEDKKKKKKNKSNGAESQVYILHGHENKLNNSSDTKKQSTPADDNSKGSTDEVLDMPIMKEMSGNGSCEQPKNIPTCPFCTKKVRKTLTNI